MGLLSAGRFLMYAHQRKLHSNATDGYKRVSFTLSRSTAATRHGASGRSIRGPITTAPAAWHQDRSHLDWPARIRCLSTAYSCVSYHARTRWRKLLLRGEKQPAPKVSEAWGLKVVCSPADNLKIGLNTVQLIRPMAGRRKIHHWVQPAQGQPTPRALPAHRRLNRYSSAD